MTKGRKIWAYRRENGRVGIRNHVAILPVDDISNAACVSVAANIQGSIKLFDTITLTGFIAFTAAIDLNGNGFVRIAGAVSTKIEFLGSLAGSMDLQFYTNLDGQGPGIMGRVQLALADYMADASRHLGLAAFYQAKRDFFRGALAGSRFELLPSRGTYFQLARYSAISDETDVAFVQRLTRDTRVAAIPVSAFFADGRDDRVIRFCFAKNEETLAEACARLRQV